MTNSLHRGSVLLTTAWVGSNWTVGYLVAPTLFKTLPDTALAGTIAGQLFQVEAWFSVFCALALMGMSAYQRQKPSLLVMGMLVCVISGYFVLHPVMANLRDMGLSNQLQFRILHGVASGIYLMQSILGAMLVLRRLPLESGRAEAEPGPASGESGTL